MSNVAVFASGNGSNFEVLAAAIRESSHRAACLITDNPDAYALVRAEKYGIPSYVVSYKKQPKSAAEKEILKILAENSVDFIALAGFLRLLSPLLVDAFQGRIVNIHPSLLPKYPGLHGIQESYDSGDTEVGITIHYVDHGLDTGPVILQKSIQRSTADDLETFEKKIHDLEHRYYPEILLRLLNLRENTGGRKL